MSIVDCTHMFKGGERKLGDSLGKRQLLLWILFSDSSNLKETGLPVFEIYLKFEIYDFKI